MTVFQSDPGQVVFYGLVSSVIIVWTMVSLALRRRAPPLKVESTKAGRLSTLYNFGLSIFNVILAALTGYQGFGLLPDWCYYLGLFFIVFGIALYLWVQKILGRFFSLGVVVYQGQELVQRGPYRFVRHPAYTGAFMIFVGIGFLAQSSVAVFLIFIATVIVLGYRVAVEEKALVSEFGDQYITYSKRVKRFVPFII